jgi:hypothetical protein
MPLASITQCLDYKSVICYDVIVPVNDNIIADYGKNCNDEI